MMHGNVEQCRGARQCKVIVQGSPGQGIYRQGIAGTPDFIPDHLEGKARIAGQCKAVQGNNAGQ